MNHDFGFGIWNLPGLRYTVHLTHKDFIPISEYDCTFVIPECLYRESIELVKVDSR